MRAEKLNSPEMKRGVDRLKRKGLEIRNTGRSDEKNIWLNPKQHDELFINYKKDIGDKWKRSY